MKQQRQVVIVCENPYYRTVFRATLVEAGFTVNDQVEAAELESHLRGASGTDLLLIDRNLKDASATQLLQQVTGSDAMPPGMRAVCLVKRSTGSRFIEELQTAGFAGAIALESTPEQIVFRVNDLIFTDAVKQRKNLRAAVSIPARAVCGNRTFIGRVVSLSKHGLYLKSDEQATMDDLIRISLALPGEDGSPGPTMELDGKVTITKSGSGPEDVSFGSGMVVIFQDPSSELKQLLNEYVAGELAGQRVRGESGAG